MLNTLSKSKWERIGTQRRAGVLVPLFSIYSRDSFGIGDFDDLKLLVDWAKKTNLSIIQLLPMNEVGNLFCPYDALSSFALEPAYLSFRNLPVAKNKSLQKKLESLKKRYPLNKPYVDYDIKRAKIQLLWEIYLSQKVLAQGELKRFKEENSYWLKDFAFFKVLKDYHQGKPWYEWGAQYKDRSLSALEVFYKKHQKEIEFQIWLQWLAFKQLREVRSYAQDKKVLLKGDLPILASRDSADVWQHPEFFKLEYASGAPPDMYCAKGQRWGMPTYNWEKIAQENYKYLGEKLRFADNFYDFLRIDHVVGLFRIWSIPYAEPQENKGLNGFFDPPDEKKWENQGRQILSVMLKNTTMFVCAEDLGMIPSCCPRVLAELGIVGNNVQRWVKDWNIKHDFLEPKDYRFLSVAMLSTPDTANWPAWWENEAGTIDEALFMRKCNDRGINYDAVKDRLFDASLSRHGRLRWLNNVNSPEALIKILGKKKEEVADFIDLYKNSYQEKEKLWRHLKLKGQMRGKCDAKIMKAVLKITMESQAIFCIETIIDWLYLTDIFKEDPYLYRTNTPGTISDKNWSLRIPVSLEGLLRHKVINIIKEMVISAKRYE